MDRLYVGVDVQSSRGCPYMVLNDDTVEIDCGWLDVDSIYEKAAQLIKLVTRLHDDGAEAIVGIDAPRQPLNHPRQWYWRGGQWEARGPNEVGNGRHCEVVIKAHSLANPQWTPLACAALLWMKLGFALYTALDSICDTYEVFPSASYTLFNEVSDRHVTIIFAAFKSGPKDMLDSCVAAFTLREIVAEKGCEVGGGDALGTIVLPTGLPAEEPTGVLKWPGSDLPSCRDLRQRRD
jgi:hypothetical protein